MRDGRALQAGTSHNLGQNFAKSFEIKFQARDKSVQYVYDDVVGRVDADDRRRDHDARRRRRADPAAADRAVPGGDRADLRAATGRRPCCRRRRRSATSWSARGVRVMLDDRDSQTPGWKFNEWELRGVPLRLEIGPKDIEKSQVVLARRDTREKSFVPMDGLARARRASCWRRFSRRSSIARVAFRDGAHVSETDSYDEFKQIMDGRPGFVVVALVRLGGVRGRRSRPRRRRRSATSRSSAPPADGQDVPQVRQRERRCTPGSRSRY